MLLPQRRIVVREKGVRHNLGSLSPRHVVAGPEIWPVPRWHARLAGASAPVATDYASRTQPLYPCVEGRVRRHVFKRLLSRLVREAGCIGHYLGYLAPRGVVIRPEVWPIERRHARLSHSSARVASHVAPDRQALDEVIEGRAWRQVLEELVARVVVEADAI